MFSFFLTISSNDWMLVWVGLEINMMSFIAIIYSRESISVEVCMKYFFIQSLGSGILMMMFFTEFKLFEYISLSVLSYKMGGGPFFFWFPAMCENLKWGSCFLLMTIQKILPLMMISFLMSIFLWFIIVISIVIGAVGSMNQKSMKRLMAYSSIHHIGWILSSMFLSDYMWMIYLLLYMMMIGGVLYSMNKDKVFDINMLGKIRSKWAFILGMLSLGGMPPLLGFYLKWWMFYYLLGVDQIVLILMIVMSVLMFYVYFRVVYVMVMGEKENLFLMMFSNKGVISIDMMFMMGINIGVVVLMISML